MGLEELRVVPPALVRGIEFDGFLEFVPFKLYDWVILLTVSVILGEECLGFGITAVSKEPARGFGHGPDDEGDKSSRNALEDERKAPLHIALDLFSSKGDSSSRNTTNGVSLTSPIHTRKRMYLPPNQPQL